MKFVTLFSIFVFLSIGHIGNCNWLPHSFWDKTVTQVKSVIKWVLLIKENMPIHEDVQFYLYTKKQPNHPVLLLSNDTSALHNSTFDASILTTFITHGWGDNKDRGTIISLRKALLEYIETNVIVVDWRRLAGQVYFHAAPSAYVVGEHLAEFLNTLKDEKGISFDKVHLIGHSLGAQISGVAGYFLNGEIGRITGLDPAGPLFEFLYVDKPKLLLDESDAKFVDVIHTAAEDFGVNEPVGHVDFYPNDGIVPQPGCYSPIAAVSCSHVRSVEFFTESLNTTVGFLSAPCSSWVNRVFGNCKEGKPILLGYYTPRDARGTFYLKTASKAPFALGMKGI